MTVASVTFNIKKKKGRDGAYLIFLRYFNLMAMRIVILYVLFSIYYNYTISFLSLYFSLSLFFSFHHLYYFSLSLLIFLTFSLSLYTYIIIIYTYKSYVLYTILLSLSLLYYSTIVLFYYTMSATVAAPTNVCSYCNRQCVYGS